MEIICMEKQTFDELVVRLSMIEKKVTGICSQTKDAALKKWMDNQEVCGILRISGGMRDSPNIQENTSGISRERTVAFHPDQEQVLL